MDEEAFTLDIPYVSSDAYFDNSTISSGFNFGPFADGYAGATPSPGGAIAPMNTANSEFSWFDPSKLQGTFSDILNAGIGATKVAVNQELKGGSKSGANAGLSFFDVLRNSALDNFTSSKTGQQIRSQVLASQVRTAFQNPMTYVILTLIGVAIFFGMRR